MRVRVRYYASKFRCKKHGCAPLEAHSLTRVSSIHSRVLTSYTVRHPYQRAVCCRTVAYDARRYLSSSTASQSSDSTVSSDPTSHCSQSSSSSNAITLRTVWRTSWSFAGP